MKRSRKLLLLGVCACAPLAAQHPARHEFTEVHLGVPVRLVLHAPDTAAARRAARAAFARIAALDAVMSDYRPDSELRRLEARAGEWVPVSTDLLAVLGRALAIARATGGAFDPAAGALTRLWREARAAGAPPDSGAIAAAVARSGWRRVALDTARRAVRLEPGVALDLGGIGKGFALQEALALLRAHGHPIAMLEAGGDLVTGDAPPGTRGWRVTIGTDAGEYTNVAVATSGPREQYLESGGGRYSHVLDPRTGWGLTSTAQVTVIATDAATADALATAFGVLGRERAMAMAGEWQDVRGVRWE